SHRAACHARRVRPSAPRGASRRVSGWRHPAGSCRHDRARRDRAAGVARGHRDRAHRRSALCSPGAPMDDELILDIRGVSCRYAGTAVDAVDDVSLTLRAGDFQAVLGPNGSGKTTLVRVALGVIAPRRGSVDLLGRPAGRWSRRELARVVGVVPQREENLFPQRVRETVLLGRYPHLSLWGGMGPHDRAAVTRALQRSDVADLADRSIWT